MNQLHKAYQQIRHCKETAALRWSVVKVLGVCVGMGGRSWVEGGGGGAGLQLQSLWNFNPRSQFQCNIYKIFRIPVQGGIAQGGKLIFH